MKSPPTKLELRDITASYDGRHAVLSDLTMRVAGGELIALLGASGSGKTTVLKIIAGLLSPSRGEVVFGDVVLTKVPAERRRAAMVFQKPLLFPHLSVAQNVAFGLQMRRTPRAEMRERVAEALRLVQLENFGERRPRQLSGGQEQRAALARALVTEPNVLLLDEPFSALDVRLRSEMRTLVRDIQRRLQITTLFVTHDQTEAEVMADRIALLHDGRLEQFTAAREFHLAPQTAAVAAFFGWVILSGVIRGDVIETPLGAIRTPENLRAPHVDASVDVAFHPSRVRFIPTGKPTAVRFAARVESIADLGTRLRYTLRLTSGQLIETEKDAQHDRAETENISAGMSVTLELDAANILFFRPTNS